MIRRLLRPVKLPVAALVALILLTGVVSAPRALAADDRLNFTGTTLSGAPFDGASLQGKPAVLWFWTPFCPFCNAEAPALAQVAAAHPAVSFVGIAAHSDVGQMQGFVSKYGLNFTNLNDADGAIWARYGVPWQPAWVFYRPDGSSTFVNNTTSAMSQQELSGRVAALTS
ncbi:MULTISPECIES: redoxin domain-containing protein [Mycobacterium]|uniref:Soluble secreted antigen MPT53 n=1 Tax=Mycobacterium kiyosense TaxID=2871094 RepID=A0A9P3UYG4_9MYCO|nr:MULTISPECIES: redoxin domain-containing protein [Mycobacterium]BDB43543.1 soluble secreted antigen MPT53 [Mycobacterium kiyosense]BDE13299.1 soluble secreted antigen MPT53 [Mycobacterium sp. 20KCMC460]GLB83922.1 soluble secreted antigen MPT53 [Mycobacterium kiyosense]GLB90877.1 soluble secreted antigen MPT53 [Mycobacterium kiyosense]GLB96440.1 soluble secreted antigen MPT53 [Mycobacterium kiyosense]